MQMNIFTGFLLLTLLAGTSPLRSDNNAQYLSSKSHPDSKILGHQRGMTFTDCYGVHVDLSRIDGYAVVGADKPCPANTLNKIDPDRGKIAELYGSSATDTI